MLSLPLGHLLSSQPTQPSALGSDVTSPESPLSPGSQMGEVTGSVPHTLPPSSVPLGNATLGLLQWAERSRRAGATCPSGVWPEEPQRHAAGVTFRRINKRDSEATPLELAPGNTRQG